MDNVGTKQGIDWMIKFPINTFQFIDHADYNKVIFNDGQFRITKHCKRGYDPWYILKRYKTGWGFAWWSYYRWTDDITKHYDFIGKFYSFPSYLDE